MRNNFIRGIAALILILILSTVPSVIKAQDVEAFDKYEGLKDNRGKIESFKKFVLDFPSSQYMPNAYYEIFDAYLQLNKIDSALAFADLSVQSFPPQARTNIYNNVAYELAKRKVGLDTAVIYAQRVADATSQLNIKVRGKFLDTQALIFYDLGKIDSAIISEEEALRGNGKEPAYLSSLAVYLEAGGQRNEALKTAAKAILLGNTNDALTNFNRWIAEGKTDAKDKQRLKEEIIDSVLNNFIDMSKAVDQNKVHSIATAFLAYTGVNLHQANKWAKESLSSLNNNSNIEDKVIYTKNYALVLSTEGKDKEALNALISVEKLADPWDGDFWYALALTYIKTGDNKKALDAFINGSIAYPSEKLTAEFNKFAEKESISNDGIQKLITKRQEELISFNPGHFNEKTKGNTVLAELFTGAQCPPCAGVDEAFDKLSEYFSREALVIMEYHVHIPAPDPMTNPDSYSRYKYYGGNFGTPTVIFDGKEKITGGGPKFLAANRFYTYKTSIARYLGQTPKFNIIGKAVRSGNEVKVDLSLKKRNTTNRNLALHIALLEKSIKYSGSNGVTNHIFVVRSIINGADGILLTMDKGNKKVTESFNTDEIQKSISKYLDDPTKDVSWRRGTAFKGWNQRTDKIDRNNLAVAAWIQDNDTKEVLQAFFADVPQSTTISKNN